MLLEAEVDRAIDQLRRPGGALEAQLAEVGVSRLGSDAVFQFLQLPANYDVDVLAARPPTPAAHLDYFVADSTAGQLASGGSDSKEARQRASPSRRSSRISSMVMLFFRKASCKARRRRWSHCL